LLISPCRDEAEYLQITIDSVAAQSVLPAKWLIVDDGSTDDTPNILARAKQKHPFIEVLRREDRGQRSVGPGVIDAFYHGLSKVDLDAYDYVCKFDTDLELGPRYFEHSMSYFEKDPWLGTLSGKLHLRHGDREVVERTGDENSVGPVKFYRTRCFREIGGFVREVCWDGIDGHMCRLHGWIAASVSDPELRIVHLRQMGSSHKSLWHGRQRWGRGKYYMGSTPLYMAAVGLYRMAERPFVVSGLGILWGYLKARLDGAPRLEHREYRELLRRFEREALVLGKRRTLRRWNERIRREIPRRRAEVPRVEQRILAEAAGE
jgi:cellulose synthase/poly-beta-1,6-N-acetylglucosamine synthase-like glycosyltransferase